MTRTETGPLKAYIETNAHKEGIDAKTFTARLLGDNPLQRLGKPEEFGALCAFICSRQAGYINGQNILNVSEAEVLLFEDLNFGQRYGGVLAENPFN